MVDMKTEKNFVLTLTNKEAIDLMNDLQKLTAMRDATRSIYNLLSNRNLDGA